jgi:prevent-host-death family protein
MKLGLREANQHFSKAIKAVRGGKEVVLTERGRPIAVIKPATQDVKRYRLTGVHRRERRHAANHCGSSVGDGDQAHRILNAFNRGR